MEPQGCYPKVVSQVAFHATVFDCKYSFLAEAFYGYNKFLIEFHFFVKNHLKIAIGFLDNTKKCFDFMIISLTLSKFSLLHSMSPAK